MGKYETTSGRFTRSMVSLSIPKTMELNSEPIFVKDDSEQENKSPPHETSFKEFEHEQSSNHSNYVDNSPLSAQPEHVVHFKSTSNDECSLEETLKVAQQSIKLSQQHKDNQLREEEARVVLKTNLQQQKNELLMWVDRWKHMKAKKDRYKSEKKLLAESNEKFLKIEKRYEEKILKIRAKLSEARKTIKLQITT